MSGQSLSASASSASASSASASESEDVSSALKGSSSNQLRRSKYNKDKYLKKTLGMCCEKMCMFNLKTDEHSEPRDIYFRALAQVQTCQKRLEHLSRKEKMDFIRTEIGKGFKGVTAGGHINLELTLVPGGPIVCVQAFMNCYDIGHTTFKKLCKHVKQGHAGSEPELTSKNIRRQALKRRESTVDYCRIPDSAELLAMEYCPDNPKAMQTFVWMKQYFEVMGEMMPVGWGKHKEIHLDSGTRKKDIFHEYKYVTLTCNYYR